MVEGGGGGWRFRVEGREWKVEGEGWRIGVEGYGRQGLGFGA